MTALLKSVDHHKANFSNISLVFTLITYTIHVFQLIFFTSTMVQIAIIRISMETFTLTSGNCHFLKESSQDSERFRITSMKIPMKIQSCGPLGTSPYTGRSTQSRTVQSVKYTYIRRSTCSGRCRRGVRNKLEIS